MTRTCFSILLATLALLGCSTPERQQARQACQGEAAAQFLPLLQQRLVTKTRAVETPTGNTTCTTVNNGNVSTTHCVAEKRLQYVPYTVSETVDANEPRRLEVERACADRLCLQRYGNADCKK